MNELLMNNYKPRVKDEPCCEPDYDYSRGQFVHAEGCERKER
jgi:hypothetical protein